MKYCVVVILYEMIWVTIDLFDSLMSSMGYNKYDERAWNMQYTFALVYSLKFQLEAFIAL